MYGNVYFAYDMTKKRSKKIIKIFRFWSNIDVLGSGTHPIEENIRNWPRKKWKAENIFSDADFDQIYK